MGLWRGCVSVRNGIRGMRSESTCRAGCFPSISPPRPHDTGKALPLPLWLSEEPEPSRDPRPGSSIAAHLHFVSANMFPRDTE